MKRNEGMSLAMFGRKALRAPDLGDAGETLVLEGLVHERFRGKTSTVMAVPAPGGPAGDTTGFNEWFL